MEGGPQVVVRHQPSEIDADPVAFAVAALASVGRYSVGEPYGDVHEIVVRFLEVDLLDGGVADVAPIRLAHKDVVEAILLLPPVGALERVVRSSCRRAEVGIHQGELAVCCQSEESFPVFVHRVAPIRAHDVGVAAPVFPLPGTCVRIHHDHNMVAARHLLNRCIESAPERVFGVGIASGTLRGGVSDHKRYSAAAAQLQPHLHQSRADALHRSVFLVHPVPQFLLDR